MEKITKIFIFVFALICLTSSFVVADQSILDYNGVSFRINLKKIKNFRLKDNPQMYVFENRYGYFAVLDFNGSIASRERLFINDGRIKKITISQYRKDKVRISIKLEQKNDFMVRYFAQKDLLKIYVKKSAFIPLKKRNRNLKQKIGIIKKSLSQKKIKNRIDQNKKPEDPFSFDFMGNIDNSALPSVADIKSQEKAAVKSFWGIHGETWLDLNDQEKSLKLELSKNGAIPKTEITYQARGRLKLNSESEVKADIRNLYIDGFWGENGSYRFGFDNSVLAGESVTYFNGIGAFFPKDLDNLFFSDIEQARIAVPELLLEYNYSDTLVFQFLWQFRHMEHNLDGFDLFAAKNIWIDEDRYAYLGDSNFIFGFSKRFENSSMDLGLFYRNGYSLFPSYQLDIAPNQGLIARKIKKRYHSFMGSVVKVYNNLSLNAEFVWDIDKPFVYGFDKVKGRDSLDIIAGVGYTFPYFDAKLQLGGTFDEENTENVALWIKPNAIMGVEPRATFSYNIESEQKSLQIALKKRVRNDFEISADLALVDKAENVIAEKLGNRAKLEFKFYF